MKSSIKQMNDIQANEISKWTYEDPYSIYSMEESDSCTSELLNEHYFSVTDKKDNILGYYCFGESAQVPIGKKMGAYNDKNVIDIGLGMNPNLCGQALGFEFLNDGIEFGQNELAAMGFRLTVATFNERAIKVYERVGFKKVDSFKRTLEHCEIEFMVMVLV